jgi:hypothetical protein
MERPQDAERTQSLRRILGARVLLPQPSHRVRGGRGIRSPDRRVHDTVPGMQSSELRCHHGLPHQPLASKRGYRVS